MIHLLLIKESLWYERNETLQDMLLQENQLTVNT